MALALLPDEVLYNLVSTLNTRDIKSLKCVSKEFLRIFTDKHLCDLQGINLYDHQRRSVRFLLERETKGLSSILNLDTGIGKTAVVLYSYILNPVPTVILLQKKHTIIWKQELAKYNVKIPIIAISELKESDFVKYRRFVLDEVHEKLFKKVDMRRHLKERTKHGVLWGLTANEIALNESGNFKNFQLRDLFDHPNSIINIRLSQLELDVRRRFRLPKFHLVDPLDYFIDVKEKNEYVAISNYLERGLVNAASYYLERALYAPSSECPKPPRPFIYDTDMHKYMQKATGIPLHRCFGSSGVIILDGKSYHNFDIRDWLEVYHKALNYDFVDKIKELVLIPNKRSIVYSEDRQLMRKCGFDDSICRSKPAHRCKLFMQGVIKTLFIPNHYNAGYNFGKVDTVVIVSPDDYTKFKQMMGRINRIDQENTTDVYILFSVRDRCRIGSPEYLITKYKKEFDST